MFRLAQSHVRPNKDDKYVRLLNRLLIFLILSHPVVLFPNLVAGQIDSLAPRSPSGILLLRNGQLLAGEYTQTGFGYEVTLQGGGIIRLKTEQVEFVSDSLDEIYSFRRASKVNNTAAAHLAMANWCLTNQLYDHSGFHLEQAIRMDPRQMGIKQIQARLAIAKSNPVYPTRHSSRLLSKVTPNEVIYERVRQLEPMAIQSFSTQLQPLLLNKCAVAGCHGPNPRSKYQLINSRWTKTTPQNISFRNLYNSLQHVDFVNPEKSTILTKATSAHGGLRDALMSVNHEPAHLAKFVNWVRILTSEKLSHEEINGEGSHLQSPIIFKSDTFQRMDTGKVERVAIPSTAVGSGSTKELNASKPLGSDKGPSFTLLDETHEDIILSTDFDDLPLRTSSNGLIKVFHPPPVKTRDLSPNLDSTFRLPSDFILKERLTRSKTHDK